MVGVSIREAWDGSVLRWHYVRPQNNRGGCFGLIAQNVGSRQEQLEFFYAFEVSIGKYYCFKWSLL